MAIVSTRARAHSRDRLRLPALLCAAAQLASSAALAAGEPRYPAKAVRIVVPYAPGGGTDVQARVIGAKLSEAWGQPVIIDNRPGGGTVIGTELVARAPADGYVLLIGTPTHVVNATLYPKLPFDPLRDFAPVTVMTASPNIFVAHPSIPARTTKEFIALARSQTRTDHLWIERKRRHGSSRDGNDETDGADQSRARSVQRRRARDQCSAHGRGFGFDQ